ncbi:Gcd10p family-domain-containing protein [Kockovaella imperatae]|uniref:tRNA (adenine(58)-N(1))-methyltransferase non-catalytic subunit TRM6 n=1 Tax=Kockovaella imperatae TaxID=4999 RepID=A0A1Y1USL7_9TREE|nr:Gcd10p family-domain-containing protein [Kockovaella imperatae]ORX41008.1 Gcd10p family-domain-containing protein [Kockovaella imperatae]
MEIDDKTKSGSVTTDKPETIDAHPVPRDGTDTVKPAAQPADEDHQLGESSKSNGVTVPAKRKAVNAVAQQEAAPLEPLDVLARRRVTQIKEGDNVLLRLPSDSIKAVVASKEGIIPLGKYGGFPAYQLLGQFYDITYEIIQAANRTPVEASGPADAQADVGESSTKKVDEEASIAGFGQKKSKKKQRRAKGNEGESGGFRSNPAWNNEIRPFKSRALVDAVIDDIQETNEFIDDSETARGSFLSHEEIAELRAQGVSAEEMMRRQIERHDKFDLKTDFSKEKWRKRKEKKFSQTIHPIAPTASNICLHYLIRSPASILHMRDDTLSQLLTYGNIRPDGRYLVVDDTGGLVTAAIMERMGCTGRILTFTDADSPPAWGVLSVMNWSERELECVKWLNWLEAEEDYEKAPPPDEDTLPTVAAHKTHARLRRHNQQVAELNATRNELHLGQWDGLILATEMSPISILARLTPYLSGSSNIVIYSPYQQILVDVLAYAKKNPNYLAGTLTESWTRTYQVSQIRQRHFMDLCLD